MSKIYTILILLCLEGHLNGQQLPLEVIASSCGSEDTEELSFQWTIGESIVQFQQAENQNTISAGFHQLFLRDRDQVAEREVRAELFPNPTADLIMIAIDNPGITAYALFNALGQTLGKGKFEQSLEIPMFQYPVGVYYLNLTTEGNTNKSFTVLKI